MYKGTVVGLKGDGEWWLLTVRGGNLNILKRHTVIEGLRHFHQHLVLQGGLAVV